MVRYSNHDKRFLSGHYHPEKLAASNHLEKGVIEKILSETVEMKELGLSRHFFSKKKKDLLEKLKR